MGGGTRTGRLQEEKCVVQMKVHISLLIVCTIISFALGIFVKFRIDTFIDEEDVFDGKAKDPIKEDKKYKQESNE